MSLTFVQVKLEARTVHLSFLTIKGNKEHRQRKQRITVSPTIRNTRLNKNIRNVRTRTHMSFVPLYVCRLDFIRPGSISRLIYFCPKEISLTVIFFNCVEVLVLPYCSTKELVRTWILLYFQIRSKH